MDRNHGRHGLTRVEMALAVGIIGCVFVMLLPGIPRARDSARQAACLDNLKKFGVALNAYAKTNRGYPPSAGVTRGWGGNITAVDGWSWQAVILPFMEATHGENQLHGKPLEEPDGVWAPRNSYLLATTRPWLLCPTFRGSPYADPDTKRQAITSYKAMGATHIESLSIASAQPREPKYGQLPPHLRERGGYARYERHPDGCFFPGGPRDVRLPSGNVDDGIMVVESVEPRFARWTVGAEATVVGFPRTMEFDGHSPVDCVPKGYRSWRGHYEVSAAYWTYRTYLNWDYGRNPYDGADGTQGGRFGPSSHHVGIVNHLFGDGRASALRCTVDVTVYMKLIVRYTSGRRIALREIGLPP
jgi:hypothetical protein